MTPVADWVRLLLTHAEDYDEGRVALPLRSRAYAPTMPSRPLSADRSAVVKLRTRGGPR
jgi:hypothetical protein